MKRLLIILFFITTFNAFSENKVSITTNSDRVIAKIFLNRDEYIILNENFLFLTIESDEYNFVFTGYPDGELQESGDVYYSKELSLEGRLLLKDGVEEGDYNINVILGFQTCDKAGICNIPVEVSEEILVKKGGSSYNVPVIIGLLLTISIIIILILKRRRRFE